MIHHNDGQTTYHRVDRPGDRGGWHIDRYQRLLVIGRSTARVMIPLDGVRTFEFMERRLDDQSSHTAPEAPPVLSAPSTVLPAAPTPLDVMRWHTEVTRVGGF